MACAAAEARPDRPELPLRTPRSRSSRSRPPALVRLLYPIDEEDAGSDERQEKSPVVTSAPGLRHVQELEGHQEALRARASALRHALAQPHLSLRVRCRRDAGSLLTGHGHSDSCTP